MSLETAAVHDCCCKGVGCMVQAQQQHVLYCASGCCPAYPAASGAKDVQLCNTAMNLLLVRMRGSRCCPAVSAAAALPMFQSRPCVLGRQWLSGTDQATATVTASTPLRGCGAAAVSYLSAGC
jgi:hypothetical protein